MKHTPTQPPPLNVFVQPPLTSYRVTNHIPSVRPGWEAQFGLQSLAMTFQPQRKCSSINLQHRQVYGYIPWNVWQNVIPTKPSLFGRFLDNLQTKVQILIPCLFLVCLYFGVFCHFRLRVLEWKLIGNFLTVNPNDTKKSPKPCSSVRLCFKIAKTNYCFLTNSQARS